MRQINTGEKIEKKDSRRHEILIDQIESSSQEKNWIDFYII